MNFGRGSRLTNGSAKCFCRSRPFDEVRCMRFFSRYICMSVKYPHGLQELLCRHPNGTLLGSQSAGFSHAWQTCEQNSWVLNWLSLFGYNRCKTWKSVNVSLEKRFWLYRTHLHDLLNSVLGSTGANSNITTSGKITEFCLVREWNVYFCVCAVWKLWISHYM